MNNGVTQTTRGFNVIFIHSDLDDCRLSAPEFRVYAHLSRRGGSGSAWPSIETISQICRLHPDTVRTSIKELERRHMLEITSRPGSTNLYFLTDPEKWDIAPKLDQADTPRKPGRPLIQPPETKVGLPPETKVGLPPETKVDEGNPLKVIQEGNPVPAGSDPKKLLIQQSEEVYTLYPRKVARPVALLKIQKAIKAHGYEVVKSATERFARAWDGEDIGFCPYPSTWYHQERFMDAPETWGRRGSAVPARPAANPVADRIALESTIKLLTQQVAQLEQDTFYERDRTPDKLKRLRELREKLKQSEGKFLEQVPV